MHTRRLMQEIIVDHWRDAKEALFSPHISYPRRKDHSAFMLRQPKVVGITMADEPE